MEQNPKLNLNQNQQVNQVNRMEQVLRNKQKTGVRRLSRRELSLYQLKKALAETKKSFAILQLYGSIVCNAEFDRVFAENWPGIARKADRILKRTQAAS